MTAVPSHLYREDPDDLLGQACLDCPLGKSNTSVHLTPADLPPSPPDGRYEIDHEKDEPHG